MLDKDDTLYIYICSSGDSCISGSAKLSMVCFSRVVHTVSLSFTIFRPIATSFLVISRRSNHSKHTVFESSNPKSIEGILAYTLLYTCCCPE